MNDVLTINEVGPRDGLQNQRVAVSCDDKLRLIQALVDAGLRSIEATSFVSPKAVPQMADADQLFVRLPQPERVAYSALVPNVRGLQRAQACQVREIAVVLSATETMNQRNINMSLDQATEVCIQTLDGAIKAGMRAKAYVAVAFECPFEGAVPPERVLALTRAMFAAGAAEVVIADTIGAAAPRAVSSLMGAAAKRASANSTPAWAAWAAALSPLAPPATWPRKTWCNWPRKAACPPASTWRRCAAQSPWRRP